MTTNQDAIKRKIRAILSKTKEGAGTTEEEAASALEFARDLMLKHQVEEFDLQEEEVDPWKVASSYTYGTSVAYTAHVRAMKWEGWLAQAICKLVGSVGMYTDGQSIKRTPSGAMSYDRKGNVHKATAFVFYGPEEDAQDARELYLEWAATVATLARVRYGTPVRGEGRSYAEGFALALHKKVNDMDKRETQKIAAPNHTVGDSSALVVLTARAIMVAKLEAGNDWLRGQGVNLRKRSSGRGGKFHGDAHREGQSHGRQADFSRDKRGLIE